VFIFTTDAMNEQELAYTRTSSDGRQLGSGGTRSAEDGEAQSFDWVDRCDRRGRRHSRTSSFELDNGPAA
jgi:hypothetical protein